MEIETTTPNTEFEDYINYFNSLEPDWIINTRKLLENLLESNNIEAVKFLSDNIETLNKMFPDLRFYKEDIIALTSEFIGYNNRIDLLKMGLEINKICLIVGAINGDQYNMFLYLFDEKGDMSSPENIAIFIDMATSSGNMYVLKFFMNFYTDEFIKNIDNILTIAIIDNRTEVIDLLIERGLITTETLINMYQTARFKNSINLKNYLEGITLLGRKRKREVDIEREAKRLRII